MLNKVLDWLDESAAGLIRLAYLLAGVLAVAAYFGDGTIPTSVTSFFNSVLPWALAFALETHTYLTARRVRSAWQGAQAAAQGTKDHATAHNALKVNLGILSGLLAFSMLNQLQYLSGTWTPPHTAFALPLWLAYTVRAVVVPLAFMAAAFLVPVGESLSARIQNEAHHFAGQTFKVARKQWQARLKQMRKQNQDVTHALIGLVDDPDERRVVQAIHQAMYAQPVTATNDHSLTVFDNPSAQTTSGAKPLPVAGQNGLQNDRPPTGPGSPISAAKPAAKKRAKPEPVIRLATPPEWKKKRPAATAEERVRKAMAKYGDVGPEQIATLAKVSRTTARKYRDAVLAEQARMAEGRAQ